MFTMALTASGRDLEAIFDHLDEAPVAVAGLAYVDGEAGPQRRAVEGTVDLATHGGLDVRATGGRLHYFPWSELSSVTLRESR